MVCTIRSESDRSGPVRTNENNRLILLEMGILYDYYKNVLSIILGKIRISWHVMDKNENQ